MFIFWAYKQLEARPPFELSVIVQLADGNSFMNSNCFAMDLQVPAAIHFASVPLVGETNARTARHFCDSFCPSPLLTDSKRFGTSPATTVTSMTLEVVYFFSMSDSLKRSKFGHSFCQVQQLKAKWLVVPMLLGEIYVDGYAMGWSSGIK